MTPAPGERFLRFVGDTIRFTLSGAGSRPIPHGWRAVLRTNVGRGSIRTEEIINSYSGRPLLPGADWRNVPMTLDHANASVELVLTEPGFFGAKAFLLDTDGREHWPHGPNIEISVHPSRYRTGNTIYCAFPRMFGDTRTATSTANESLEAQLSKLDKQSYTLIPPSGKLRDLKNQLDHIFDALGCRILHLLPVNPTPTTYARFGRFGSPYASLDLTAVDPALVEFDRRTTGVDQFCELTFETHRRGGRVFLDLVINHTGWGSHLQEQHPDWFLRSADGLFVSPGAWGVTWEDLVELDHRNPAPWAHLAEVFLTWCRRGVDGFRCDAGYKVPMPAWRYITARVRREFPETIFLLEGLGGSWQATEILLTEGGMQWAYSELFQNYQGGQVATYLDYSLRQSERAGIYVHYSETHDNDRLANRGRAWSLLRNRLCALASVSGAFGFTCGVEWLAAEKIHVHSNRGLSWGNPDNLVAELAALNRLLAENPCFFEGAKLTRLSPVDSPVYALRRDSFDGAERLLVLINTEVSKPVHYELAEEEFSELGHPRVDLLKPDHAKIHTRVHKGKVVFNLEPGACHCLTPHPKPAKQNGEHYRQMRAWAAFAIEALRSRFEPEELARFSWRELSDAVGRSPRDFLAAIAHLDKAEPEALRDNLQAAAARTIYSHVAVWRSDDIRRQMLVPANHWLLIEQDWPFRAALATGHAKEAERAESICAGQKHYAAFWPRDRLAEATLSLERYGASEPRLTAPLRFLASRPAQERFQPQQLDSAPNLEKPVVLLTNGRGGMARLPIDLGSIKSKYDCVLGANLHPAVPVDRHIFAKRIRVWVNADDFITPLDGRNLVEFEPGPPARWKFTPAAGDGRSVGIELTADMLEGRNTTVLRFRRTPPVVGRELPDSALVHLVVRIDIEDRNFHTETHRNGGAEYHFSVHCQPLEEQPGFKFKPSADRRLRVFSSSGRYHHQGEWSRIAHPIEESRGQTPEGDAYSPGWFELPLIKEQPVTVVVSADSTPPSSSDWESFEESRAAAISSALGRTRLPETDPFGRALATAVQQFVVRRDDGKTVIAGYPWFLDWGRDTLICARGLLAAGFVDEVEKMLTVFGRFEKHGTLPNTIHGEDASNRDTSDAPLWYGIVCEEMAAVRGPDFYRVKVDRDGRTIADVLTSIAENYRRGTPNGIVMAAHTGFIRSPAHFTWMDTNWPAATPRTGYPVEIQVMWLRLLRQLSGIGASSSAEAWGILAERIESALEREFWIPDRAYFSDLIVAQPNHPDVVDRALRPNFLFAIALGVVGSDKARLAVDAAARHLVVSGAVRTLAPVPVEPSLEVRAADGRLLNNPFEPYCGKYEGDEDTHRKPAYHNGTAWVWLLPTFCEALVQAWDRQPAAVRAAKSYLTSLAPLLENNCVGQLPEILDGDAPHAQRGCDAQAWSATEALRVWKWLNGLTTDD